MSPSRLRQDEGLARKVSLTKKNYESSLRSPAGQYQSQPNIVISDREATELKVAAKKNRDLIEPRRTNQSQAEHITILPQVK